MAIQNPSAMEMKIFLKKKFYIPNYQREYSWERNHVEDFWIDLENLVLELKNNKNEEHFFGQILVHADVKHDKKYIIDGQQRTTSSIILLKAFQSVYEDLKTNIKDSELSNQAFYKIMEISEIIGKHSRKQDDLNLHLGDVDKLYFKNSIQLGYPTQKKEKIKSHDRIKNSFFYFKENLQSLLGLLDEEQKIDKLDLFYDAFTSKFKIMYVEATDLGEAFVIFETLNARGKELETSDLLKNHLFSNTPQSIENSQKLWNEMLDELNQADPTKYIRHFWNSYQPFTRDKQLYRNISKTINSPKKSDKFLNELKKYAPLYSSLSFPRESIYFKNNGIKEYLENLKLLKASTFYPIIIALKQRNDFTDLEMSKIIYKLEVLIFRNFTICGQNPSPSEIKFARIAKDIYDETLKDFQDIINEISKEIVSDEQFKNSFLLWTGSSSTKEIIRYIFRSIHQNLDPNHELNINNSEVHIEHIMPDNKQFWKVEEDTHKANLWRLGNLTLLSGPLNIEISNKPFKDKQAAYADSVIYPNKELVRYSVWGESEIKDRQKRLFEYAIKIWHK